MPEHFFEEQLEQSQVKIAIVIKYFDSWAKVITGAQKAEAKTPKIGYIDLFAGPGRYDNGTPSTPLVILDKAIHDPLLRQSLVTLFNDKDKQNAGKLRKEIQELSGIGTLAYQPDVFEDEVGDEIVKKFEGITLIPALLFVDPWGYKGLSLRLIKSVMKDWACECIFFFNYSRINMGLSNDAVKEHMQALFGEERATALTERLKPMTPDQRELTIVEELAKALAEAGGKYILPFGFKNESGKRTKHHLIFVSKHPLGYKIMKRVMAAESSAHEQGVPTFEYSPATQDQPLLFELARPLDELEGMLLETFAGKTMTMAQIYDAHNYGRRYIDKNYKDALTKLEVGGKIKGNPPHHQRPKRRGEITCADKTVFTFPPKKQ